MKKLKNATSIFFLFLTWILIFICVSMLTDWIFAPWDVTWFKPTLGTWERTLTDFFDFGIGQFLFSVPAIIVSCIILVKTRRQDRHITATLALSNLALVISLFFFTALGNRISDFIFGVPSFIYQLYVKDIDYRSAAIPIIAFLFVYILWTVFQYRLFKDVRKAKRQFINKRYEKHKHRLEDKLPQNEQAYCSREAMQRLVNPQL